MGEVIRFPVQDAAFIGRKCKVCGGVMVLTHDDREREKAGAPIREKCFCCERAIPLPLSDPHLCIECNGTGVVRVHVCRDGGECERQCPKEEQCMACLGTGRRS